MAGFMSGFGSAFSQSFNQARQNSAVAERDDVRMAFETKMQNRKYGFEQAQKTQADIREAKSIAKMTGQPEEAWREIYNMRDVSPEQRIKWARENQINISRGDPATTPSAAAINDTEGATDLTQAANSSVNTQMAENGMIPKENGGLFDKSTWGAKAKAGRDQRIEEKVNRILGPDASEELTEGNEKELSGLPGYKVTITPKKSEVNVDEMYEQSTDSIKAANWVLRAKETGNPELIAKAEEMYSSVVLHEEIKANRDKDAKFGPTNSAAVNLPDGRTVISTKKGPDGKWLVDGKPVENAIPIDPAAKEMMARTIEKVAPRVKEHDQKVAAYNEFVFGAKNITDILEVVPDAMTGGASLAGRAKEVVSNIQGSINIFLRDPALVANDPSILTNLVKQTDELKTSLTTGKWSEVEKNGIANRIIEANKIQMAYAMARTATGGSGRDISNQDFQKFYDVINAGGDKVVWQRNTQDFLSRAEQTLDLSAKSINEGNENELFKTLHGYNLPIKMADDTLTLKTTDDKLRESYDKVFKTQFTDTGSQNTNMSAGEGAPTQSPEAGGYVDTGKVDANGQTIYRDKDGNEGTL